MGFFEGNRRKISLFLCGTNVLTKLVILRVGTRFDSYQDNMAAWDQKPLNSKYVQIFKALKMI